MPRVARQIAKVAFIVVLAFFFPKIVLGYLLCGLYDVSRNNERTIS